METFFDGIFFNTFHQMRVNFYETSFFVRLASRRTFDGVIRTKSLVRQKFLAFYVNTFSFTQNMQTFFPFIRSFA